MADQTKAISDIADMLKKMAKTSSTNTLTMKLLVDAKAQRVLFAEAGKDMVGFLLSLLALPVATAVKLVGADSMPGSFGSLYTSVEKLDSTYLLPDASKEALLRPAASSPAVSGNSSLFLPAPTPLTPEKPMTFYKCTDDYRTRCSTYITDMYGRGCPSCGGKMTTAAQFLTAAGSGGSDLVAQQSTGNGFVQGFVTYTVMDDLTVTSMSAVTSITLLNTCAVKDLGDLQEKTVRIGFNEGLEILRASLQSKTVLTDVFLRGTILVVNEYQVTMK